MPDPTSDQLPDDKANAALLRNVKQLMAAIIFVTFLAVAAILGVIGYRVSTRSESPPPPPPDITASLPPGARVVSTAISEDRLAVTLDINGATEVRLYDLETLEPAGRLRLSPAP